MHKFDPAAHAARAKARQDFEAHQQASPSPNTVPALLARLKLLERLLGGVVMVESAPRS